MWGDHDPDGLWGEHSARLEIYHGPGQKFGPIINHEPPNSKGWAHAARELRMIGAERVRLAGRAMVGTDPLNFSARNCDLVSAD